MKRTKQYCLEWQISGRYYFEARNFRDAEKQMEKISLAKLVETDADIDNWEITEG